MIRKDGLKEPVAFSGEADPIASAIGLIGNLLNEPLGF